MECAYRIIMQPLADSLFHLLKVLCPTRRNVTSLLESNDTSNPNGVSTWPQDELFLLLMVASGSGCTETRLREPCFLDGDLSDSESVYQKSTIVLKSAGLCDDDKKMAVTILGFYNAA